MHTWKLLLQMACTDALPGKPLHEPLHSATLGEMANVSVPSRVLSAQPSHWQVLLQPSPLVVLLSSQSSPPAVRVAALAVGPIVEFLGPS